MRIIDINNTKHHHKNRSKVEQSTMYKTENSLHRIFSIFSPFEMNKFLLVLSFLFIISSVYSVYDSGGRGEHDLKVRVRRTIDKNFLSKLFGFQSSGFGAQSQARPQGSPKQVFKTKIKQIDAYDQIKQSDQVPQHDEVYSNYANSADFPRQNINQIQIESKSDQNANLMSTMVTMIGQFMQNMAQFLGIQNTVRVSDVKKINKQVNIINEGDGECGQCLLYLDDSGPNAEDEDVVGRFDVGAGR